METERAARLVVIFGPAAVGKMTIGQELARLCDFRLLYNHMVVDLVTELFPFGTPAFHRLAQSFTQGLLDEAAATRTDLVLTHAFVFGHEKSFDFIDRCAAPFVERGGDVFYVELTAPLDVRLGRNETENRRRHKKLDWATPERLREMDGWGRWNSDGDFPYPERHMLIDTTSATAAEAANAILARFGL